MSAFADAAAAAFAALQVLEGVPVLYCRGGESCSVTALVGRTIAEIDDVSGLVLERIESRDYMIAAVDLVIGSQRVTPQSGDQVKEVIGGVPTTWELTQVGIEPCFRFSDPDCTVVRVHTKRVS